MRRGSWVPSPLRRDCATRRCVLDAEVADLYRSKFLSMMHPQ